MRISGQRRIDTAIVVAVLGVVLSAGLGTLGGGASRVHAQARPPAARATPRRPPRGGQPAATDAPGRSDAERARALLAQADFDGALAAADAAEQAANFDRDGLISLLETRVLIESGLGRAADVDRDLARLATLAPDRAAPSSFPPPIAQRLAAAQADAVAPSVDAAVSTTDDGATVTGTAGADPTGLVRGVRVAARVGEGAWQTSETGTLTLPVEPGETLAYYALALGPGGVVLASAGTESEPLTRTRAAPRAVLPDPEPVVPPPSDDTALFVGLGVGGGVLVLGVVIVIAAVAGSSNDSTLVTLPMER